MDEKTDPVPLLVDVLERVLDKNVDFEDRAKYFDDLLDKAHVDKWTHMGGCDWIEVEPILHGIYEMLKAGVVR